MRKLSGIIAYLIDLETLIQSIVKLKFDDRAAVEAKEVIIDSVSVLALLPFKAFGNSKSNGIDISGLNGKEQILPQKVLTPVNIDSDELRFEYKEYTMPGSNNVPKLNGGLVDYRKYTDLIIESFKKTCEFIMKEKDALIGTNSVIDIFKGIKVRNVLKSTSRYASLLEYSYHPSCTSDFLRREKLMENMWAYPYENKSAVKYEVKDMLFDDIPIFFSYCDSKDLISSEGNVIKDYFDESGLDRVKNRIKKINKSEIDKQIAFMVVAFEKYMDKNQENKIKRKELKEKLIYPNEFKFNYLDECLKIADSIYEKAIYSKTKDSVTWMSVLLNKHGDWEISPLDCSIYQGLSGIALFYYEIYKMTKIEKYHDFYKKIMKSAFDESKFSLDVSAYFGRCSLVLPLLNEYKHSGNKNIIEKLDEMHKFMYDNISKLNNVDFLHGISGVLILVLNCFDILKDQKYLNLAIELGECLLNELNNMKLEDIPCGMAHGASGISLSLFKLSSYTKDTDEHKFKFKAIELLEHDRKVCDINIRSWCHGTSGIGLSRIEIKKFYSDIKINDEINKYLNFAIENDDIEDCVCHGNLSDIEFLIAYNNLSYNENITKIIKKKFDNLIFVKDQLGTFGLNSMTEFNTIDLFAGASGISYELLRFQNPNKVPNILTLNL